MRDFSLIHKFKIDNTYIVLDINTGIVHSLSKEAYDFLTAWEETKGDGEKALQKLANEYDGQMLQEIWESFELLEKEGMLFSPNEDYGNLIENHQSVVKALCLHVSHDCNLRCRYCFGGTGNFGGSRVLMDFETGKKAFDFLFKTSGPRRHIEVDYFGGEPLMNFEVVKKLIKYGKEKAKAENKILKQTLTTNGTLLDQEKIDFLNDEGIYMILSIDGRPEVHNYMRPFAGERESYSRVFQGIKKYVESQTANTYYVRGTYTHFNLDFCNDVLHLVEEGFDRLSMEPVVASPDNDYALKEEDLPTLKEQYEKLARAWLEYYKKGTPFEFFHYNVSLDKGPCIVKRLTGCGAGHEYLAVSPEGDLYPCHQFVGEKTFKMGTVFTGVTDDTWGKKFKAAHALNKEECKKCWARYFCSGGCHANAYHFSGNILEPYALGCELQKKRLECAIYLQVECSED